MEFSRALGIVRLLIDSGVEKESAINNAVIPPEFQDQIRDILTREQTIILTPAGILTANPNSGVWLDNLDRQEWYYWPALRDFWLSNKGWSIASVRSVDEATDRILGQIANPNLNNFDIRGLVIGFIQSGKTANYTALIAKCADVGYRLVIVLSGIDNGLRRQTQIRLDKELVGFVDQRADSVFLPPPGKRWHQFTSEDLQGDFRRGYANYAALQGNQPVLLVVKKNGPVLRRLHAWLDESPEDIRQSLPVLVIDDEADQASVDTRGTYIQEGEEVPDDFEEPSVINGLIRSLLNKFTKKSYIAYTATPFANVLIPHDVYNPTALGDLYPKDFIVDLPKPHGYFGAEEQFGRFDPETREDVGGMDIVRIIPVNELIELRDHHLLPPSVEDAMLDFVLAGAARAFRGQNDLPSTMLLHGSHLILLQMEMFGIIEQRFSDFKDEWRYTRSLGIRDRLKQRWENDFIPVTSDLFPDLTTSFEEIEPFITPFFESIRVKVINSRTGDVLDYETEKSLKAIAVGGNRLSRGLTLEGLTTSYFFRSTPTYDTLMQMGRWFGFKNGYADLSRIYMTDEISGWFNDLARVEYELRQDIKMYEEMNVTPLQFGPKILRHPAMLVTSRLKQRNARTIYISQSYSNQLLQTFRFPFSRPVDLTRLTRTNLFFTKELINSLGNPEISDAGPLWRNVNPNIIIEYLRRYQIDHQVRNIYLPLVIDYISSQNRFNELVNWTIAIKGRTHPSSILKELVFNEELAIPLISRTRLKSDRDSLGVITSPGDEASDLDEQQLAEIDGFVDSSGRPLGQNPAARALRAPTNGLLLIYPVSKYSGYDSKPARNREPIFENPDSPECEDIICLAISFPRSSNDLGIDGEYIIGTVEGFNE